MCPHAQNSTYTLLLLFCQSLCVFLLHVWKPPSRLPPSRKGNFCSFWKISGYTAAFIQDVCTCPKCDEYHAFGLLLCCVRVMRPRSRSHGAFFTSYQFWYPPAYLHCLKTNSTPHHAQRSMLLPCDIFPPEQAANAGQEMSSCSACNQSMYHTQRMLGLLQIESGHFVAE